MRFWCLAIDHAGSIGTKVGVFGGPETTARGMAFVVDK